MISILLSERQHYILLSLIILFFGIYLYLAAYRRRRGCEDAVGSEPRQVRGVIPYLGHIVNFARDPVGYPNLLKRYLPSPCHGSISQLLIVLV